MNYLIAVTLGLNMVALIAHWIFWWKAQVEYANTGKGWVIELDFNTFQGEPVALLFFLALTTGATLTALFVAGRLKQT